MKLTSDDTCTSYVVGSVSNLFQTHLRVIYAQPLMDYIYICIRMCRCILKYRGITFSKHLSDNAADTQSHFFTSICKGL